MKWGDEVVKGAQASGGVSEGGLQTDPIAGQVTHVSFKLQNQQKDKRENRGLKGYGRRAVTVCATSVTPGPPGVRWGHKQRWGEGRRDGASWPGQV